MMVSPSSVKSRRRSMARIASSEMSVPRRALIFPGSSRTVRGAWSEAITSMTPSTTSPQPSSSTSSQARWTPL